MPDHEIIAPYERSMIPHVGTYRRVLPVNLERMYENTLDWEHLPHVHAGSFRSIECLEAGPWGWRARVVNGRGHPSVIELRLDRRLRRWITRTLEGRNQGGEIWTHVFETGPQQLDIVIDFFVPGVADADREKVGRVYANLYETLYDEDVAMMVERQRQLDRRVERPSSDKEIDVGQRADLNLPKICDVGGRSFVLSEIRGELVCYPALCPHQLGPLDAAPLENGIVRCPWHGYEFDVKTGDCVSGQSCRLVQAPAIAERDGRIVLTARH